MDFSNESSVLAHPDTDAMESTPHELHVGELHKPGGLAELSTISSNVVAELDPVTTSDAQHQHQQQQQQQLKVYLRVRPFSKEELANNEDQGCVTFENGEVAILIAPKESATMKNSERGIGQSVHKFSFSKIFGPETSQIQFFEGTVQDLVNSFLEGQNALVFTYGVTNAGKTHTIQGSVKDAGILPRSIDLIFNYIKGRQYTQMDLKPYLSTDVQYLDGDQINKEKSLKSFVFSLLKEDGDRIVTRSTSAANCKNMIKSAHASLSFSSVSYDQTESTVSNSDIETLHFSVWISFYEIYNECVFDLLEPLPTSKNQKRANLRVCEDHSGNSYIKDLKWINVHSSEEACKILKIGNKHRSAATTKMNQASSRSHSIFSIKLLQINGTDVQKMSELSLCDLAGSERCNKTKTFGERLKEAGNINNSLLILGKCISVLRQNQNSKMKNNYVPFRESKLTRLFQGIFCGKGRACMIVNINQCASTYDETLHVMKFSAVAKQVVQIMPPKSLESLAPRLVGKDGKMLLKTAPSKEEDIDLSEEELLDESDDEEMSLLPQEELVSIIESLKEKLLAERRRNLVQEIEVRKEMGEAMLQQLMETEETWSNRLEELKESYEEKLESTFDMYKDAIKQHAYQRALEQIEDEYVPVDEFLAEQEKVEELRKKISEMEHKLSVNQIPLNEKNLNPTEASSNEMNLQSQRYREMLEENIQYKRLNEENSQLLQSMMGKTEDLSKALKEAEESILEKLYEIEMLKRKVADQEEEIESLQNSTSVLQTLVSQLQEELESKKLCPDVSARPKIKKGLLANLKASVKSPVKPLSRALKKSVNGTPMSSLKKNVE
ncbi:kinesin-like protein KIF20A isoform X2 [Erpetoichthys calabaricus]|uniref:kinesin-like protein KIF20A isoform X2 n=1 Tax=Erpetoichthys calabaricus TaxID=27687 RepID=UPI002234BAE4|nr:kinesin-like protein KIF20A isoform X2 [Erpetoichthys calabaricus]